MFENQETKRTNRVTLGNQTAEGRRFPSKTAHLPWSLDKTFELK
jgi:hypothetical protein